MAKIRKVVLIHAELKNYYCIKGLLFIYLWMKKWINLFLLLLNLNKKSFNSVSSVHWTNSPCLSFSHIHPAQLSSCADGVHFNPLWFALCRCCHARSFSSSASDWGPTAPPINWLLHVVEAEVEWMDTVAVGHWIIHLILLLLLIESRRNEIPVAVYGQINSEYTYILSVRKAPPPSSSANSTQEVTIKAQ